MPASTIDRRICSRSASVAGTRGRRGGPTGCPIMSRVAYLAGRGVVTRGDQLDHLAHVLSGQMRGHGDDSRRSQAHQGERVAVVAREDLEPVRCIPDDPRGGVEVGRGVLHGDDVPDLPGQSEERVRLDQARRAAGDVVEDDRERGGRGDAAEVGVQTALGRPVVVRRHDQRGVAAGGLGVLRQLDRLGRRVRARAGDDLRPAPGRLHHGPEQVLLLLVRERRRLAGRTRHDQRIGAVVEQPRGQFLRSTQVQGEVLPERGRHRGDHGAETPGHLGCLLPIPRHAKRRVVAPTLPARPGSFTMDARGPAAGGHGTMRSPCCSSGTRATCAT